MYIASTSSAADAGGAGGVWVITRARTFFSARLGTAVATPVGLSSSTAAFPSGDPSADRCRFVDLELMTRYHDQPRRRHYEMTALPRKTDLFGPLVVYRVLLRM